MVRLLRKMLEKFDKKLLFKNQITPESSSSCLKATPGESRKFQRRAALKDCDSSQKIGLKI